MGNDILVSVIMPVYNVQKYIDESIKSVINQTYKNLEIIMIDDGATDNSGEICDAYAKSDSRIKVIHKKNGGISSARNTGLENAHGKYIYFIDSDDVIKENLIYDNLKIAEEYQCDLVLFRHITHVIDDDSNILEAWENSLPIYGIYDEKGFNEIRLKQFHNASGAIWNACAVWNRLYTREIIGDTRFYEKVHCAEDLLFNIEIMKKRIKKIYYGDKLYHFYKLRTSSLTNSYYPNRFDDIMYVMGEKEKLFLLWNSLEECRDQLDFEYTNIILREYENLTFRGCPYSFFKSVSILKKRCNEEHIKRAIKRASIKDVSEKILIPVLFFIKCKMYGLAFLSLKLSMPIFEVYFKLRCKLNKRNA